MTRLPFLCALACAALFCTPAEVCGAAPDELSAADRAYASAVAASFPVYRAAEPVSGLIRLWGHGNVKLPWMMNLVHRWESGFQRFQPGIKIRYEMHGTSSAVPSLYTGVGDIAILGEEILPEAVGAFERAKHYPPTVIPLLTGSLSVRNFDYAQMLTIASGFFWKVLCSRGAIAGTMGSTSTPISRGPTDRSTITASKSWTHWPRTDPGSPYRISGTPVPP
jgi:hypothetical protein